MVLDLMSSIENLLEPIRHSPRLPELVSRLRAELEDEQKKRDAFYRDMTPAEKVEFIDGEIFTHRPARNRHLDVTSNISMLLRPFVSIHNLGTVKVEKCLCVFPRNDYEPDIVFFGPEKSAQLTPETLKFPVPDLAVEVLSASTQSNDRGVKFEDYAANGVGEYWIVDAEESVLEQYLLREDAYHLEIRSGTGQLISRVIEGFEIALPAFFDEDAHLAALRGLMG